MAHTTTTTIASSASAPRIIRHSCYSPAVFLPGPPPLPGMSFVIILYLALATLWRGSPPLSPPCACRSPGGAVIMYVCHRWEVAEAVLMSSSRLDEQRWRCGAGSPSPPPRALAVPLALILRSIATNTGSMARMWRLVAAVAKEEWQWRRRWPAHQQMASAMRCGRPLAPPRACHAPGAAITFACRCS